MKLLAAAMFALAAVAAQAEDYPAKPIRFVIPFPPGSGIDTMSRVLLDDLRKHTNATFVTDNRSGALGQIGTEVAARATPDGYTVMISSSATHSSGPQLVKKVPYDPFRDFTHIVRLARFDVAMVVSPARGWKSAGEFIAAAKAKPEALTFGYGSATAQVTAASFNRAAGIQARGIPYKGQPLALTDLLGGQIDYVMADLAVILSHVKSGRLAAIALASSKRSAILPGVPTLSEQGVRDVELAGWVGISGPAGMAKEAVEWWTKHTNAALARGDFLERLNGVAVEGEPNTVPQFNAFVREQHQVWGTRIREAGVVLE